VDDWGTIVGHVTILAAALANLWYQWKREARRHDWQRQQDAALHDIRRAMQPDQRARETYDGPDGC